MLLCRSHLAALFVLLPLSASASAVDLAVDATQPVSRAFLGLGANMHFKDYDPAIWETVVAKRITESTSPGGGMARFFWSLKQFAPKADVRQWDTASLQNQYQVLQHLEGLGVDVFLAGNYWSGTPDWLGGGFAITPENDPTGSTLQAYADLVAEGLDNLVNRQGFSNLRWWTLSNEMQTKDDWNYWGKWISGGRPRMPEYEDYNRRIWQAMAGYPGVQDQVGILATDAGDVAWTSNNYAIANMDDIVGTYGSHYYKADNWREPGAYDDALADFKQYAATSAAVGKPWVIGEFGGKGFKQDRVWGKEGIDEPIYGVFIADRIVAGLNAGLGAMLYWEIHDVQGSYWHRRMGLFKDGAGDWAARPFWYMYAQLTRAVRPGSDVFATTSTDTLVRAAVLHHPGRDAVTALVVNRRSGDASIDLALDGLVADGVALRRYLYDPAAVPQNPFGDLPGPDAVLTVTGGGIEDSLPSDGVAIYTSDFDAVAPVLPSGVGWTASGGSTVVDWDASAADDLAYYRIYRDTVTDVQPVLANQVGSTVATSFTDDVGGGYHYLVTAVDRSGNESLPTANQLPVIEALTANPDPVTGTITVLALTASDTDGDALAFSWTVGSAPTGAAPQFDDAAAEDPVVTFDRVGDYRFDVVVDDGRGGTATAQLELTVEAQASGLELAP